MNVRILVVEDEAKVAKALRDGLTAEQYEVETAQTGEEGFYLAQAQPFDLLILDLMLPGRDGLQILSSLRSLGSTTPVLILTARDTVEDRVNGLDLGADDYLVKPFAFPELLARIRALMRRGRGDQRVRLRLADLEMDLLLRRVMRHGQLLALTPKEYDLLEYLLRNHGQVVSREMLARDVWGESTRSCSMDNVIDVTINRLRKHVDWPQWPRLIHTVRGVGFALRLEED